MRGAFLLGLLVILPAAAGQAHEHENSNGVLIAHDVMPDGHTYVGNLNHFVVLYLGTDAEPDFHQQNHVRVTLDNVTVFETTPDSGHDYDGMYGFDVVFGRPGEYHVEVLQDGAVVAGFGGTVHPFSGNPTGTTPLALDPVPAPGTLTGPYTLTYGARDGAGNLFPHSDAILEVFSGPDNFNADDQAEIPLQSQALLLRVKTHTHTEEQVVRLMFDEPDSVYARVATYLSYPEKGGVEFLPSSAVTEIQHFAHPMTPDAPEGLGALGSGTAANVVVTGTAGGEHLLLGTFDPYDVVGPRTLQRLGVAVLNPATYEPIQHVNFDAQLVGPLGNIIFDSDTLHEYDGIFEFETVQNVPGRYTLVVDADRGNWTGHIELPYTVSANPIASIGAGPQIVTFDVDEGLLAGEPAHFRFTVADAAGNAFQHGEIDVIVERMDGPGADPYSFGIPVLRAKLHTHASGEFEFDFAFPGEGTYHVRALPYSLGSSATPYFFGGGVGGGHLVFPLTVGADPDPVPEQDVEGPETDNAEAPGLPPAVLLATVGLALVLRRRARA